MGIEDAGRVFHQLQVDDGTHAELQSILAGFKDQCVVNRGEVAPQDPGMCRAKPAGNSAYAMLGGVYPIALFADRLVGRVLQGDRVQVQWNHVDYPAAFRHPPGLKYMVTELFCHAAGGPEVATSKGFDDAKLGINPNQWNDFLTLVVETSTVWPTRHHRDMIMKLCENSKAEICFGLEGQGDAAPADLRTAEAASPAQSFQMTSKCPFSGQSGGQCPFSGQTTGQASANATEGAGSRAAAPLQGRFSEVAASTGPAAMVGRVLDSSLQQSLDELLEEDPDLCCPVSLMLFAEPVRASDGFIYEKSMLMQLFRNNQRSPMTREVLKQEHRVVTEKMAEVLEFRHKRSAQLITFAVQAAGQQPQIATTAIGRVADYLAVPKTAQARQLAAEAAKVYAMLGQPIPAGLQNLC